MFPKIEKEIMVNTAFFDDPDYEKHIMDLRRKVGFFRWSLVSITDRLFPASPWQDVLGSLPVSENDSRG